MEPRETMEEPDLQAPCPKCGQLVHIVFKFCPFCGLEMKVTAEEAKPAAPPKSPPKEQPEQSKNISPDAQRTLMEFEKQFEELRRKSEGKKPVRDSSVVKIAIVFGILILLGLIGFFMLLSQFTSSLKQMH